MLFVLLLPMMFSWRPVPFFISTSDSMTVVQATGLLCVEMVLLGRLVEWSEIYVACRVLVACSSVLLFVLQTYNHASAATSELDPSLPVCMTKMVAFKKLRHTNVYG